MKKKILILSTFLLLSPLNATEIYTVDELIVQALKHSPDLELSANDYATSKSKIEQVNAGYLPQIDLGIKAGEMGQSNIPANPDTMLHDTLIKGTLSLQQLLYDFGKTASLSDTATYSSESFSHIYKQKISDKKLEVKSAYFNVLQKIALIKVNEENIKLNEAQLYRAQKYFEAGIRTKIDVSDAKVELIKSKIDLNNSQYDLKLTYTILDKILGYSKIYNDYKVYAKELDLTQLYSSIGTYPLSLEEAVAFAYNNRYEIKKQEAQQKLAQSNLKTISTEYYPTLYLNANYTKQSLDTFKTSLPQNQWQTLLNLDVNLYKGGQTEAQTQEANIAIQKANTQIVYTKLTIKTETTQAYINVQKAKDAIALSQSLLTVSKEKFEQASKRYEHGLADFIELQQSRQGYIDAMSSLIVDYYRYYDAIAILDNAIGR